MSAPVVHPSPTPSHPQSGASSVHERTKSAAVEASNTHPSVATSSTTRKYQDANHQSPFDVSSARRWTLLVVMSLAIALDVVNVSALLTATESIVQTIHLEAGNIIWVCVRGRGL